jgi:hypothetical protein
MSEKQTISEERREFYRLDDEVLLDYRRLPEAELEGVRERLADRVPDGFTVAATFQTNSRIMNRMLQGFSASSPELARYLKMMDQKLNHLARLFVMEEMDADAHERVTVNLSAGGMTFPSRQEFSPGDLLEMRVALMPNMVGLLIVARVVYCERSAMPSDYPWQVAVEYEVLRESDRDLLCSHIMARETELRRLEREAQQG